MIKLTNITKKYNDLSVLKGVNLDVKQGEFISIVGASGAGKTTLLQIIGTLDKADSGQLIINDDDISSYNDIALSKFRNEQIGFVFQSHNLLPEFSALENICLPALVKGTSVIEAEEKAKKLLQLLNLKNRSHHKPSELSGGEQQRVAVVRALINRPSILLADEPSGNLDSKNADELHELISKINKEFEQTCILVTHNNKLAQMADRKLSMVDGVIV